MHQKTAEALNTLGRRGRVIIDRDDKGYFDICRVEGKCRIKMHDSRDIFGVWTYSGVSLTAVIRVLDNHFQRVEAL